MRHGSVSALLALACATAFAATPATQPSPEADYLKMSPEQLLVGIEQQHPAAYYVLATKLFETGRKDEAVFWFYAGQLRFRFRLLAHPDLDPSGEPALFASLGASLGPAINEYAFGDLESLHATLRRVLDWDATTENGDTSKVRFAEPWKQIRAGLAGMIDYIDQNGESIRKQRTANGLENRGAPDS